MNHRSALIKYPPPLSRDAGEELWMWPTTETEEWQRLDLSKITSKTLNTESLLDFMKYKSILCIIWLIYYELNSFSHTVPPQVASPVFAPFGWRLSSLRGPSLHVSCVQTKGWFRSRTNCWGGRGHETKDGGPPFQQKNIFLLKSRRGRRHVSLSFVPVAVGLGTITLWTVSWTMILCVYRLWSTL